MTTAPPQPAAVAIRRRDLPLRPEEAAIARDRSKMAPADPVDDAVERLTFGAGREVERHAMAQDRMRQRDHIVGARREASFDQRARARREHERLAGARSRSPG